MRRNLSAYASQALGGGQRYSRHNHLSLDLSNGSFPETWAGFRDLTGLDLDSLYTFQESSGNLIDRVAKAHQHKTAATSAWDAGASSVQTVATGGTRYVEFVVYSATDLLAIGLSPTDPDSLNTSLQWGLSIASSVVSVIEAGLVQATSAVVVGDHLRIGYVGTTITYERQVAGVGAWTTFYTSLGTDRNTLVQVGVATTWASVACGYYYTVAVRTDGTLWSCGYNGYGQLGDGTNTNRNTLVQVGVATTWASVACGSYYTVAVRTDGTLWSCGYNGSGQLGDGTLRVVTAALLVDSSLYTPGSYFTCQLWSNGVEVPITWQNVVGVSTSKDLTVGGTPTFADAVNGRRGVWYDAAGDSHRAIVNNPELLSWLGVVIVAFQDAVANTYLWGTAGDGAQLWLNASAHLEWRLKIGVTTVSIDLGAPTVDGRHYCVPFRISRTTAIASALASRRGSTALSGQASTAGLGRVNGISFGAGGNAAGAHVALAGTALGPQVEAMSLTTFAAQLGFAP